jgi:hypothetical protein
MIQFNPNKTPYIDQYGYNGIFEDISAYFFPQGTTQKYVTTSDCDVNDPFADCTKEQNVQQLVTVNPTGQTWTDWLNSLFEGYGQDTSTIQISPNMKALLTIGALALTGYLMYFRKGK